MATIVDTLFEDLRAILLKIRKGAGVNADSGDVARPFRDYVARCSDMMSPG